MRHTNVKPQYCTGCQEAQTADDGQARGTTPPAGTRSLPTAVLHHGLFHTRCRRRRADKKDNFFVKTSTLSRSILHPSPFTIGSCRHTMGTGKHLPATSRNPLVPVERCASYSIAVDDAEAEHKKDFALVAKPNEAMHTPAEPPCGVWRPHTSETQRKPGFPEWSKAFVIIRGGCNLHPRLRYAVVHQQFLVHVEALVRTAGPRREGKKGRTLRCLAGK